MGVIVTVCIDRQSVDTRNIDHRTTPLETVRERIRLIRNISQDDM